MHQTFNPKGLSPLLFFNVNQNELTRVLRKELIQTFKGTPRELG
nr:MAG TPA: hypothetical protein [Bacteriophage sp.]